MRVINFLPDDYLQRRSVRQANLVCLGLAGGAAVLLALAAAFTYSGAKGTAAERAAVDRQYQEAGRQIDQLKALEDRKTGLFHKVELSTTLLERVPRSTVLARLANHLPAHTSLTMLTMRVVEETEVRAPETPGVPPKGKVETVKVKQIRFRLEGLARTDVEVAEFITRLNADPLFEDVDLLFSEEFTYEEGLTMRRFQLSLRLSPKADKVLETASAPVAVQAGNGKGAS
jgi:Tfp pilus assembly protein PilN